MNYLKSVSSLLLIAALASCQSTTKKNEEQKEPCCSSVETKVKEFATVKLTTDVSKLDENQKKMLSLLFDAGQIMDDLFWKQAYGDKNSLLTKNYSPFEKQFLQINYGPWERLDSDKPFIKGIGEKPAGAQFYPLDMTKKEFNELDDPRKTDLYTVIQRDEKGKLTVVPYHALYAKEVNKAAALINQAAGLAKDAGLKKYLQLRAEALLSDDYYQSDIAWLDMKDNTIDFVVGPIESYEDKLFGYKASYESFILVKDKEWSKKLDKFVALLPGLQKELPCADEYKAEAPANDSELNAYDVVYYGGDCNAGSKTIAINLPNDEKVRANKGSRKLQLKNAMRAKFDKIMVPIANLLIVPEQREFVKFDAFFENTMFHEVAHGLGMGNVKDGSQTVRSALKETYSSLEEGKADILGLWVVTKLSEMGQLDDKELRDNFTTFMAGIFRSVRFGASDAHGIGNMVRFYYFKEHGAFSRDPETGLYKVNFDNMKKAMTDLSDELLTIQGDGDYARAKKLIKEMGYIRPELQKDLDRIAKAGIPRDIVYEQGKAELGLIDHETATK